MDMYGDLWMFMDIFMANYCTIVYRIIIPATTAQGPWEITLDPRI